jgi:hypothetical protein
MTTQYDMDLDPTGYFDEFLGRWVDYKDELTPRELALIESLSVPVVSDIPGGFDPKLV